MRLHDTLGGDDGSGGGGSGDDGSGDDGSGNDGSGGGGSGDDGSGGGGSGDDGSGGGSGMTILNRAAEDSQEGGSSPVINNLDLHSFPGTTTHLPTVHDGTIGGVPAISSFHLSTPPIPTQGYLVLFTVSHITDVQLGVVAQLCGWGKHDINLHIFTAHVTGEG